MPKSRDKEEVRNIPTQTLEFKAGKDVFNFPTPSPRMVPPRSATLQPSPARSPLSATQRESPKIGVAIGSPGELPRWGRSQTADPMTGRSAAQAPMARAVTGLNVPSESSSTDKLPKKKASWKNFGSIFSRKPSVKNTVEEPFYKLRAPQEQDEQPQPTRTLRSAERRDMHSPAMLSPEGPRGGGDGHRRTPSMTRGMARLEARAEADRTAFLENEAKEASSIGRGARTPTAVQRDGRSPVFGSPGPRTSEELFKSIDGEGRRNDSPLGIAMPRLDLDIPDFHMERYRYVLVTKISVRK